MGHYAEIYIMAQLGLPKMPTIWSGVRWLADQTGDERGDDVGAPVCLQMVEKTLDLQARTNDITPTGRAGSLRLVGQARRSLR
jgi:hypothetical protein